MKKILLKLITISVLLMGGCSKSDDDDKLNKTLLSMQRGDTFQLEMVSGNKEASFSSDNKMIAEVNPAGLVTANTIGEATIKAGHAQCVVTVNPKYSYFNEPLQYFGLTMDQVKLKLGTPSNETANSLGYNSTGGIVNAMIYSFNTSGKVSGVAYAIKPVDSEKVVEFLDERYVPSTPTDVNVEYLYYNALTESKATVRVSFFKLQNSSYRTLSYTVRKN